MQVHPPAPSPISPLPLPIPDQITDQGLVVVYVILTIGLIIAYLVITKIIPPWLASRQTNGHQEQLQALTNSINSLNSRLDNIYNRQAELITSIELNTEQTRRFNASYHDRLIPTMSMQSLAMLELAGLDNEARNERRRLRALDRKEREREEEREREAKEREERNKGPR